MTKPMVQPMPASTFAQALLPAIAPHSVATSEAPTRPLTTALVTVLLWLLVCAMYVMLVQNAGLGNGPGEVWQPVITATIMMSYLPLIIASVVLVFAFARYPDTILSPRGLASVGCLMLLVVLPLMQTASVLTTLWFKNQPLDQFFIRLEARGFFIWWLHGCTIALAFGAQAAYASLQRTRMQELAWQREQTERLALRLRLLQGQLKPHFLFNALNSISALVRTADRDLACKALAQLRDLLSYAVQASCHDWRSVADELGFVRDYLDLQMLRYGERLSLDWQVADCAWHELACPPLLLQPLVENAIHHGVENHHGQCQVRLCLELDASANPPAVRLIIHNPLIEPKPGSTSHRGHGVGLVATRERLALLYPDQAQLDTTPDLQQQQVITTLQFPAKAYHAR